MSVSRVNLGINLSNLFVVIGGLHQSKPIFLHPRSRNGIVQLFHIFYTSFL